MLVPAPPLAGTPVAEPVEVTGPGEITLKGLPANGAACNNLGDCTYKWAISCTDGPEFNKTGESVTVVAGITGARDIDWIATGLRDYACEATYTVTDAAGRANSATVAFEVRGAGARLGREGREAYGSDLVPAAWGRVLSLIRVCCRTVRQSRRCYTHAPLQQSARACRMSLQGHLWGCRIARAV